ncbi:hypothetical protein DPMN_142958 [Dreissena polymorpha]|uniref:Uncharacterized protein n=1 Tax=Dreissena polymorpha TaxID=45954 RepID=A0A9D4GI81_DREPO|nr:hypothetical protein DPMN_142958 [Dreissena polymorpha]
MNVKVRNIDWPRFGCWSLDSAGRGVLCCIVVFLLQTAIPTGDGVSVTGLRRFPETICGPVFCVNKVITL